MATPSSCAPLGGVSPLFIVGDLHASIAFYRDALGFAVTLLLPEQDPFFGIVRRDGAELLLKAIGKGIAPLPNPEC
jgi:catechol 2,3-dioxygenase-like lactoylglutathione lyase family enzyme